MSDDINVNYNLLSDEEIDSMYADVLESPEPVLIAKCPYGYYEIGGKCCTGGSNKYNAWGCK